MSPMDAAMYNALALLHLFFPPSLHFTQQRRWRSAPRTKESGSGSNFSNSWRFGAPWAPHAQKQLLDFGWTKGTIPGFENHPKIEDLFQSILSKQISVDFTITQNEDTTKTTHNNKLLEFIKITPKMTIPLKVKTQDKLLDFRITQKWRSGKKGGRKRIQSSFQVHPIQSNPIPSHPIPPLNVKE